MIESALPLIAGAVELPICGARARINLTGMNVKLVHISKNTTPMDVSVVVVGAGASGLVAAMAQFMHGMGFVRRCVLLTASKIQLTKPPKQFV